MRTLKLLTVLCAISVAAPALADPTGLVKWSQLPDMETGIDYGSMINWAIAADDFECTSPWPVVDVHWWGSYWEPEPGEPQPIDGFIIRFLSDVVEGEFSHPGAVLYETCVLGNCNETFYGYSAYDDTNVYQYYTEIPAFDQVPGEIYWISIQVVQGWDEPPYWGWHNSRDDFRDDAVQALEPSWDWWDANDSLAFELTVVPEPGLFALAAFGLLALIRRKR